MSNTYLVTNPCLLPVAFAQRITAAQLKYIKEELIVDLEHSQFAVVPYSQAAQRKLRQDPDYSKRSLKVWTKYNLAA